MLIAGFSWLAPVLGSLTRPLVLPVAASLSLPIIAIGGFVLNEIIPLTGTIGNVIVFFWVLAMFPGFYELMMGFTIIWGARSPSVALVKNIMKIGFGIFGAGFGVMILVTALDRGFSILILPFDVVNRLSETTFLTFAVIGGICSYFIWTRWSSVNQETLCVKFRAKITRRDLVYASALAGLMASFILLVFLPAATVAIFIPASATLVLLTLIGNGAKPVPVEAKPVTEKFEWQDVGRDERLSIAREVSDRIVRDYPRRVHAVYVPKDDPAIADTPKRNVRLSVVVRDGMRLQDRSYLYKGLFVQIYYWQEIGILGHARTLDK